MPHSSHTRVPPQKRAPSRIGAERAAVQVTPLRSRLRETAFTLKRSHCSPLF